MRKEHTLNILGYKSEYWAFHHEDFSIDILPSVLFAKACDNNNWSKSTKRVYSHIVELFFRAIRLHDVNFRSLSNTDLNGFLQGYYFRKMPGQVEGRLISLERMRIVRLLLIEILKAGVELGFCESRSRSIYFKMAEGTREKLDEADELYTNYISLTLFNKLISNVITKKLFEQTRDMLALRFGYECGLRSEELVRSNNFAMEKLYKVHVDYQFGESIEWPIIGKGRDGGKRRNILIKPALAEMVFDFTDQFRPILKQCDRHTNHRVSATRARSQTHKRDTTLHD